MEHLRNKVALITGASRGIGAETARVFAKAGAAVVLAARTPDETVAVAAEINAAGGRAEAVACDVAVYGDVEAAIARAESAFGPLDILVNNAGLIEPIGRIDELAPEEWGKVIDVNVKGVFHGLRAALPGMRSRGAGVIVNISSGAATNPLEGWSHYCASKAAALMLTRCADAELGDGAVRVVGLSPGTVATEMQVVIRTSGVNPVSQLDPSVHIPAEWAARAIAWAAGPEGAEFHGRDIPLRDETIRRRIGLI
ncbi:SDR family oxidoreductase [Pikeienuella piscinae]|uniref:SDR family oxidoreductase n=1 Tax=Pikeienuella piscinae TaxID=2748098 RepID=A0A7M3T630_9RHOB|nr:SDR family oxidoreductase [Pikeienuella piscinae]QIE57461.1 SDR family oxidoreductase [Pikeienuella piscinae]